MKILLTKDGSHYLVDVDKLKPKSVRELATEAGDHKLLTLDASSLRTTTMDELLAQALKPATPTVTGTSNGARSTPRSSGLGEGRSREQNDAVRAWGQKKGYDVKDIGRIKNEVYEAYDKANGK